MQRSRRQLSKAGLLAWISLAACAPAVTPIVAPAPLPPIEAPTVSITPGNDIERGPLPEPALAPRTLPSARQLFGHAVDSLIGQDAFRTATWGILVVDDFGDTVFAHNPQKLLIPASNMKVVTAATALAQLGGSYKFTSNFRDLTLQDTYPRDFGPNYSITWLRNKTLGEVIKVVMKESQNRLSEQLFKTIALEKTKSTLRDSSIAVISRQLSTWGIESDGFVIYDGSGYDRKNYLSAETLVKILNAMQDDTAFVNSFPIAGVDGTLIRRMKVSAAEGNATAKTGSLRNVRSLSGYVRTLSGRTLTFSFICNAFTVPGPSVTAVMDYAVQMLAEFMEY